MLYLFDLEFLLYYSLPVSHALKSCHEILLGKSPLLVLVIILEHSLPVINVVEQFPKLMYVDGAGPICVEHVDHHPARLLAEHGHVAVSKGRAELLGVNLATVILERGQFIKHQITKQCI